MKIKYVERNILHHLLISLFLAIYTLDAHQFFIRTTVIATIVVAIAIAVAASGTFRSVEYHGQVLETLLGVDGFKVGEHGAVKQPGTYHKDSAVG